MPSEDQAEQRPQPQPMQPPSTRPWDQDERPQNSEHTPLPVPPGIQICTAHRPELSPSIGRLLVGNLIDQDGDIVSRETGQVLARAAGDLPSMVGRQVSNAKGDILGENGELLGYVTDVTQTPSPPRSLFDVMGHASSSLMVDHMGNILDSTGTVVGKFRDNNAHPHPKEEETEVGEGLESPTRPCVPAADRPAQPSPRPQSPTPGQSAPRRTEEERRESAAQWRKENPSDSPSDIFLDVKSTREGIQLTIRIPTVFPSQQATPHISFT